MRTKLALCVSFNRHRTSCPSIKRPICSSRQEHYRGHVRVHDYNSIFEKGRYAAALIRFSCSLAVENSCQGKKERDKILNDSRYMVGRVKFSANKNFMINTI